MLSLPRPVAGLGRRLLSHVKALPAWGLWFWLLAALASAWLIVGHYHADEIGQITAFLLYKVGLQPPEHLPWEFAARMRSWLQPGLYYVLVGPLVRLWGYDYRVVERLLLLVQVVLLALALRLSWRMWLPQAGAVAPVGAMPILRWGQWYVGLWWFLPSMLVRHSSEALASILLVACLGCWHRVEAAAAAPPLTAGSPEPAVVHPAWWGFCSGLAAGLAFWARFQSAFFVAGFWATRLAVGGGRRRQCRGALWWFAVGVVLTMPLGLLIDRWGYGEAVFSPFHYYYQNIVEQRSTLFGTAPWHRYLVYGAGYAINPLLWVWLLLAAVWLRKNPWYAALAGGLLVFGGAHSWVAHKEIRFLLPAAAPASLLLLGLFELLQTQPWRSRGGLARWLFASWYVKACVVAHAALLVGYSALGLTADRGMVERALWRLPAGSVVFDSHGLYLRFGTPMLQTHPERRADYGDIYPEAVLTVDAQMRSTPAAPLRYGFSFAVPPHIAVRYVSLSQTRAQCLEEPQAVVLLTNRQAGPRALLQRPWAPIAAFPPAWLARLPFAWVGRMWHFKLVRCADFVAASGPE